MCLDTISHAKKPKDAIAWKLFYRVPGEQGKLAPLIQEGRFRAGVTYFDGSTGRLYSCHHGTYKAGFHAFATLDGARRSPIFNDFKVVRQVRLSNITAVGTQDGCKVIVGRTMTIIPKNKEKR